MKGLFISRLRALGLRLRVHGLGLRLVENLGVHIANWSSS